MFRVHRPSASPHSVFLASPLKICGLSKLRTVLLVPPPSSFHVKLDMRELHPQPLVSSMLPPAHQKPAWISLTLQRYRIFRASKAGRRIPVASGMSRGPVPSQLHLLSNLPALSIGDKVRFLGWYDQQSSLAFLFIISLCSHTLYDALHPLTLIVSSRTQRRQPVSPWLTSTRETPMSPPLWMSACCLRRSPPSRHVSASTSTS